MGRPLKGMCLFSQPAKCSVWWISIVPRRSRNARSGWRCVPSNEWRARTTSPRSDPQWSDPASTPSRIWSSRRRLNSLSSLTTSILWRRVCILIIAEKCRIIKHLRIGHACFLLLLCYVSNPVLVKQHVIWNCSESFFLCVLQSVMMIFFHTFAVSTWETSWFQRGQSPSLDVWTLHLSRVSIQICCATLIRL